MRKLFLAFAALAAIFALPQAARAQTQTYVSGTVTGSDSIAWAGARISASIVSPGGASLSLTPCTSGAGCPVANPATGGVQAGGAFGMNLWANGSILPAGTTYTFTAAINGLLPAVGTGPQTCTVTGVTVAGATQTVNLSGCPPLTNIAGGGGGTCTSGCVLLAPAAQQNINASAAGYGLSVTDAGTPTRGLGFSQIPLLDTEHILSGSIPSGEMSTPLVSWMSIALGATLPASFYAAGANLSLDIATNNPLAGTIVGVDSLVSDHGSGTGGTAVITGLAGVALLNGTGAPAEMRGLDIYSQVQNASAVLPLNTSLYIESPVSAATGGSVTANRGIYIDTQEPAGATIGTSWGIYEANATEANSLGNLILRGVATSPNTSPICPSGTGGALSTSGCSSSGTVNTTPIHAPVVGAGPSSATIVGPSANCTVPTGNGQYQVLYNVTASAAVDPSCPQVGLSGTAGLTGSTSSYTILYSDNAQVVVHDYAGSSSIAVTLLTPTTLGNAAFVTSYCDYSAHADTITPTTWTINGSATLPVPTGTCFRISVDPNNAALSKTNWLAIGSGAPTGTAGGDLSGTYPNPTVSSSAVCKPGSFTAQTDGATVTWAIASAVCANAALTFTAHGGSRTLNLTGLATGGSYVLKLIQDGTGGENLTGGTGCTWKQKGGGGGTFTLTATASAMDILAFTYDGTNCLANLGLAYN